MSQPQKILEMVQTTLEDLKAIDAEVLNVGNLTSITDLMVVVSGRSTRHVKSMADEVIRQCKQADVEVIGYEGEQEGEWILIDLAYVIVHIMLPRVRDFYKLEKLWSMDSDQASNVT